MFWDFTGHKITYKCKKFFMGMFEQAIVSIRTKKRFLPKSHPFVSTQCAATFYPEQKEI